MKKIKRFFRKVFRPVFLGELLVLPFVLLLVFSALLKFVPDQLAVPPEAMQVLADLPYSDACIALMISWCGAVGGFFIYFCVSLFTNLVDWLSYLFVKRRKGPENVKDNLIQVYVDDVTLGQLEQMADMAAVSVPVFCYCVLQSLEPDELAAAAELEV